MKALEADKNVATLAAGSGHRHGEDKDKGLQESGSTFLLHDCYGTGSGKLWDNL
jgi:hypothetical protein